MKLANIIPLLESFADAERIFASQADSPEAVKQAIADFKQMNQKNLLSPEEKDITRWVKKGWTSFQNFIDQSIKRVSNKETKKLARSDSVKLYDNGTWMAVVPLTKDASCFYGKNTRWCTSATESTNYFDSYFSGEAQVTLIYFINKESGERLALAVYHNPDEDDKHQYQYEAYNADDTHISPDFIFNKTGVSQAELLSLLAQNKDKIDSKRMKHLDDEKINELRSYFLKLVGDGDDLNIAVPHLEDKALLIKNELPRITEILKKVDNKLHAKRDSIDAQTAGAIRRALTTDYNDLKWAIEGISTWLTTGISTLRDDTLNGLSGKESRFKSVQWLLNEFNKLKKNGYHADKEAVRLIFNGIDQRHVKKYYDLISDTHGLFGKLKNTFNGLNYIIQMA